MSERRGIDVKGSLIALVGAILIWYWARADLAGSLQPCPYPPSCSRGELDRFRECIERRQELVEKRKWKLGRFNRLEREGVTE